VSLDEVILGMASFILFLFGGKDVNGGMCVSKIIY